MSQEQTTHYEAGRLAGLAWGHFSRKGGKRPPDPRPPATDEIREAYWRGFNEGVALTN
jgi:hypothetical protein